MTIDILGQSWLYPLLASAVLGGYCVWDDARAAELDWDTRR